MFAAHGREKQQQNSLESQRGELLLMSYSSKTANNLVMTVLAEYEQRDNHEHAFWVISSATTQTHSHFVIITITSTVVTFGG